MNELDKYRAFCEKSEDLPLFHQGWWLDIVCQSGSWNAIMLRNNQDECIAVFPYFIEHKYGMDLIKMPPLSPYLGPWIKAAQHLKKLHSIYSYERKIVNELFDKLPQFSYLNLLLLPEFRQIMPLKWSGFKQTNELTYILNDIKNIDKTYDSLSSSARNKINKAKKTLSVEISQDFELLWDLQVKTFSKQNMAVPYSKEMLLQLHEALSLRKQSDFFVAIDHNNKVHAGNYIVYDKHTAYNLIAGADPEYMNSGAVSLIIWEAIQQASRRVNKFDFEGGMFENIESFFRSFGAEQILYSRIMKTKNKALDLLLLLLNKI